MSVNTIPHTWDTERLVMRELVDNEIHTVQALYEQGGYISKWDGREFDTQYIHHCFTIGDLPPNGDKEHFKIQSIRVKETGIIAGLLIIYHGYPTPQTVYVTYLYIDQNYQKQGLGQEVINGLFIRLKRIGYGEVRANVALKNWTALRFWIKLGLNSIGGIYGHKEHSADTYADVELIKYL
ncbi:GNAT family N-acetyltransferase [Alicyclobacillus fodiniaquatilis]|uniref:GNAT family N-acetyltransferase n=1 Tax=Alicyclobacillus fodiniaquatilis TaxID=1661150 RepID=A0ABW4JLB7_9BACL